MLSSLEAKFVALSEVVKDIMFIAQLLDCMEVKVYYPITVQVDSVGVIFCLKILQQQVTPSMLILDTNMSMNMSKME